MFVSSLVVVVEVWVVRSVLFVSVAFTICGASRMPLTIAAMVITENKANVLFFPFMAFTSILFSAFGFGGGLLSGFSGFCLSLSPFCSQLALILFRIVWVGWWWVGEHVYYVIVDREYWFP